MVAINTLSSMLKRDLAKINMNQGQLAKALSIGASPMSSQGISLWKIRERVPKGRLPRLREVLGLGSEIAKADDVLLCGIESDGQRSFPRVYQRQPVPMQPIIATTFMSLENDPFGFEANFLTESLPESLRKYTGRVDGIGPLIAYKPTYRSDHVIAMVQKWDAPTDNCLLNLMVLGRAYPGTEMVLILVNPENRRCKPKTNMDTVLLGIRLEMVKSEAEVADCLVCLERWFGKSKAPDC